MRKINFSAGPSMLPIEVLNKAQEELLDYKGLGYSIMEISHRSKVFEEVHLNAINKLKSLYGLNDDYEVLFLQGGASLQFAMIAMNLSLNGVCEYVDTGVWTSKAIKEANILNLNYKIIASSKDSNYDHIPDFSFSDDADYAYICSNNTIYGTQYSSYPSTKAPLIVDASSDFCSRPVNFDNIGLFYGGVQKNAGISGLACIIIRKDMLQRSQNKTLPSMLSYHNHAINNSLFNTPPTFAIYIFDLVMSYLIDRGGLDAIHSINTQKAKILYDFIDNSEGFYIGHSKTKDRSLMNVSFNIKNKELEKSFLQEAEYNNLIGLKGHRLLGGIRASIYNAISLENVKTLIAFMADFKDKNI